MSGLPWDEARQQQDAVGLADRQARDRIRAGLLGAEPPKLRVGRFLVLRLLVRGGMVTVHAAYDDRLQREVAIKVLHPDTCADEAAQHRLVREAQAQARLSHPHLVPVFEVGHFEGQIYLAMELVEGTTMLEWIAKQRPSPREILAQWLDVARALVVVHAEGLVHRDVKPANVLIGGDGRARLVDFGLARGQVGFADQRATLRSGELEPYESASPLEQGVTQSKTLVGTPAYMAPEVLRGEPAGPLADQFSLCVSIYESLVGERPWGRAWARVDAGPLPRRSLARPVYRVLRRGLCMEPAQRFGSMAGLADALEPVVTRRRERRLLAGAGLGVAAMMGAAAFGALGPEVEPLPDPCAGVQAELDAVWNEPERARLREGLLATELPYAGAMSMWMEDGVDEIAERWRGARHQVCEARAVDRTLSEAAAARARQCLDGQRDSLQALLAAAAEVRPERVPSLVTGLQGLGSPEECAQRARLEAGVPAPPDELREQVDTLRTELRRLRVQALLEGSTAHLASARQLLRRAEALAYAPLVAEASMVLGLVLLDADDPRSRAMLERAANEAERVGDLGTREDALSGLAKYALNVELDAGAARRALERDVAVIARMGEPPERGTVALEFRALLRTLEGSYDAAERDLRALIAQTSELGPAHAPRQIAAWHYLGSLLAGRGRADEAAAAFATADEIAASLGLPASIVTEGGFLPGRAELLRGLAAMDEGQLDEAAQWLERAVELTRRAYGDDSVPMARVHMAKSKLAKTQGRLEDVLAHAKAAEAIVRRWLGDDNALRLDPLSALGTVAFYQGDAQASVAAFSQAVRLAESTLPAGSLELAIHRSNLGEALVLTGDDRAARSWLESALESVERMGPELHPQIAAPSHGLAEIEWRAGDLERAASHAERALKVRAHHGGDPPELARTRWLLARIVAARGDRARARTLAEAARQGFDSLGTAFEDTVREIDAWLRAGL
ncbi:MAG: serine/threonine-protein kinase [Nannocystaceae bacterium]